MYFESVIIPESQHRVTSGINTIRAVTNRYEDCMIFIDSRIVHVLDDAPSSDLCLRFKYVRKRIMIDIATDTDRRADHVEAMAPDSFSSRDTKLPVSFCHFRACYQLPHKGLENRRLT